MLNVRVAIVLLTLCFIKISEYEAKKVISLKLNRMKSGFEKLLESGTDLEHLNFLYSQKVKEAAVSNVTVPLFKFLDYEYYAEVLVGHPGQKFKVVFDTTWGYSWITSKRCNSFSIPCILRNKYDHDRSSTYIENGTAWSDAGLKGFFSTDLFHIGQVNVTNQTFLEITSLPMAYVLSHADGMIGLAFPDSSPGVAPLFLNLIRQGTIHKPVFSFYMNRDRTTEKGGSITIGAVDKEHIRGPVTYVKVTKKYYWEFQMDKVYITTGLKDRIRCKNGCFAFTDTSVNSITVPPDDLEYINNLIGAEEFVFGKYRIPCERTLKSPFIKFVLNGKNFTLKGSEYTQQMTYGGIMVCLSAFEENTMPPNYRDRWILGGAFLSRFYAQYDLGANVIGFAAINNNATDIN